MNSFRFLSKNIPFNEGESIAAALEAAGIRQFGRDAVGHEIRYFCGIGACQCCLVRIDGVIREACVTPARAGAHIELVGADHE
ncbi:2Fe-2S iron-sulfur cluster-binding protein [Rhizobium sp. Root482]|jgi:predicted molibdopterin-dependent oxidoreductase YjgC|uniref:2Fe-2S iron-sulfur cluster-binding protein n=1 Tax=Rhizobium sp. Root482 TaxID=1736543 RepID=UPI0006F307DC|nr:2Fe-2S iron-sulfur cluster-binding protein [Rhizobium sp. Root482]KQY26928.1 ferredoxin [Rhizobium sp. Root482]